VSPARRYLSAAALLVLVSRAYAQCPDGTPPPCAGARPSPPTIAIQPFTSLSPDSAEAYRAVTLTEDLTTALTDSRAARVLGGSLRSRAEWTLSGSVRRAGDLVRYAARLERSGEVRWTTRLEGPVADDAALRDSLAVGVLGALGVAQRGRRPQPHAVDPVAYDLWLRGRYYFPRRRERDVAEGVALLQRAVARDTTFARAWVDLANALGWALEWRFTVPGIPEDSLLARILAASERAVFLDSGNADVWRLRASVAGTVDPTSNVVVLSLLRRALALDSSDAGTWQQYAIALDEAGDSAGAEAAFRREADLEPDHPVPMLAYHYYWFGRRLDTAAVLAERAVEADPRLMFYRELQGEVALARGRVEDARAAYEAALRLGQGREQVRALCGLAAASMELGDSARARTLVAQADALVSTSAPTDHDAIALAGAYAALGETERALGWLERYQPRADLHFQLHLRDVLLDPLRNEPRFRALLRPSPP
jgi:tetratricopeptide (TPR) repeat protein/TolB-like protein